MDITSGKSRALATNDGPESVGCLKHVRFADGARQYMSERLRMKYGLAAERGEDDVDEWADEVREEFSGDRSKGDITESIREILEETEGMPRDAVEAAVGAQYDVMDSTMELIVGDLIDAGRVEEDGGVLSLPDDTDDDDTDDDTDDDGSGESINLLTDLVRDEVSLRDQDTGAHRDAVIAAVLERVDSGRSRVEYALDKAKTQGEIYEPSTGVYRTT